MTFQRLSCGVATLHHSHPLPLKPENKTGWLGQYAPGTRRRHRAFLKPRDGWLGRYAPGTRLGSATHSCDSRRRETRWLSSGDCRSNLQVAGVSPGRDAGKKNSGARLLGKCSVITFAVSSSALARAIPSLTISGGGKGRARWG